MTHQLRRERRKKRKKQKKTNTRLKKKLFGHLAIAPCYYCRKVFIYEQLTIEHITPLCLGGTNDATNITLACAPCNHERGRIAWRQKQTSPEYMDEKRRRAREHYEQYSPEYHGEDRVGSLSSSQSPSVYSQGEGV